MAQVTDGFYENRLFLTLRSSCSELKGSDDVTCFAMCIATSFLVSASIWDYEMNAKFFFFIISILVID